MHLGNVQVKAKDVDSEQVVEYCADIVVCTTSLGVLQKEQIEFIPPLPDWKKRAIHEIGMFCFAKVFARFDEWLSTRQGSVCHLHQQEGVTIHSG